MAELVVVGIADLNIVKAPDRIITYALGSCVGIFLYDPVQKIAGLSHVLLPESNSSSGDKNIMKYADTAIEELVRRMELMGCRRNMLVAKIAGGADMFSFSGLSIGQRNVETTKRELARLQIKLVAEDTGSNYGRTVECDPETGNMIIKTLQQKYKVI